MSKEMSVILLGFATIVVPYLGIPGSWRVVLLVLIGAAVSVIGFLLRGEALKREGVRPHQHNHFTESIPTAAPTPETHHDHGHKEGITSLN